MEINTQRKTAGKVIRLTRRRQMHLLQTTSEQLDDIRISQSLFYVNSVSCKALRDSGSAVSIVRRDVSKGVIEFTGENMNLTDAFGRSISILIARVKIRSSKFGNNVEYETEVGVSETLK